MPLLLSRLLLLSGFSLSSNQVLQGARVQFSTPCRAGIGQYRDTYCLIHNQPMSLAYVPCCSAQRFSRSEPGTRFTLGQLNMLLKGQVTAYSNAKVFNLVHTLYCFPFHSNHWRT